MPAGLANGAIIMPKSLPRDWFGILPPHREVEWLLLELAEVAYGTD